jgi:transposase InsO family protein
MKRKQSAKVTAKNLPIMEHIKMLKAEHPFWGYRRIGAHLQYVDGLAVNGKRILRLMREHNLLVKETTKLKAIRTPPKSKPRPDKPNQWWGIDMTKVMVKDFGWIYIVSVLDWYTKKIVGYYAGLECRAKHWLEALDMATQVQFPKGVRGERLHLMSDNGCQPASVGFMKACRDMGITQAFTSYNNPKGNADTERLFRTMKEEILWLREWSSPFELSDELRRWINHYNQSYLHSSLGYKSPINFEEEYQICHCSPLVLT